MGKINTDNLVVDINQLKPNEYNPKLDFKTDENNAREFEKIKKSLEKLGQVDPILVREIGRDEYEIVNGYHRWEAMKELGYKTCEIKSLGKIDFDMAVSHALMTEDTKIPIDNIELAELTKKLVTPEKPIEYWANLLPYDAEIIKSRIELLDFDFSQYDEEGPSLTNLTYIFKFSDEAGLAKIKDYFEQFPKDERGQALVDLIK